MELKDLPSVDEVLKSTQGGGLLKKYPRRYVLEAIRQTIDQKRKLILSGGGTRPLSTGELMDEILIEAETLAAHLSSLSLRPVINATGIVVHTNLGRSPLSEKAIENIVQTARGYSNLEYDLAEGKRGKRYAHIKRLLRETTGAEDGIAVNNNAGAVLLALSALSKGREVIVSRGELVEIGGSFRIPDVMAASGAILREVGTTNKTHLYDYERAINENTALVLKVHQSNYRIRGFTSDVPIEDLVTLGKRQAVPVPVMYDLGSGCLTDLAPYGILSEPTVQRVIKTGAAGGADIVTFSGDKLLGGPQAGIVVGKKEQIDIIQKNPLTRALRIDKLTLAALEATLMQYIDEEKAKREIPALRMLLEEPEKIRERAKKIAAMLVRHIKNSEISVVEDVSFAGGGALPDETLKTYAVAIRPEGISVNRLEERLRLGSPPVVARIKEDALLLDARTVRSDELRPLAAAVSAALS
jgi:L-seryl-tRNA(Ser) seleniumtransferase